MRSWSVASILFAALASVAGCGDSVVGGGRDAGGIDATVTCATGQTACSGRCVDTVTDRDHCGACGTRCPGGQVCATGRCAVACPTGQVECAGACVTVRTDRAHCGACGRACGLGEVCAEGQCGVECGARLARCGGTGGDAGAADGGAAGFCADLQIDRRNCGQCGAACPAGNVCEAGACVVSCIAGRVDCGGSCRDTQRDSDHCGACGRACPAGQICNDGACGFVCPPAQVLCGSACRDLQTDQGHCGSCGNACPRGQVCTGGACLGSCPEPQALCGSACVTLATDNANCGACGAPCPAGEVCSGGACRVTCGGALSLCAGSCRDLQTDNRHCGACGTVCPAGELCTAGACAVSCVAGLTVCGRSCYDLQRDSTRCGACGTACAAGQSCVAGACRLVCPAGQQVCGAACRDTQSDRAHCGACDAACPVPANGAAFCAAGRCDATCGAGFGDCDGAASNGCETTLGTAVAHCGACGRGCSFANAAATCAAGACVLGACVPGFANCDGQAANGCEVDTRVDRQNCNACARACASGEVCSAGACTAFCGAGLTTCGGACTNTSFDPAHCGGCGTACPARPNARPTCSASTCSTACNAGFGDCDGVSGNGCETNLTSAVAHCGACGSPCAPRANASASCAAGACVYACAAGFGDCDGNPGNGCEAALGSTNAHCGACGNSCGRGSCVSGTCAAFGTMRALNGTENNRTSVGRGPYHSSVFSDPVTGRHYLGPSYASVGVMYEYPTYSDLLAGTSQRTITLPAPFDGTYQVAVGGVLYYARANSNTIVRVSAVTGALLSSATLAGAGFRNTACWDWGGYSDINFYLDVGNRVWVAYAATSTSNIQLSELDPATLAVRSTHNIATSKRTAGWGFLVNGFYYIGGTFNSPAFEARYDIARRVLEPYTNSFTPQSGEYITHVTWNPTSRDLFVWSNQFVTRYPNVP